MRTLLVLSAAFLCFSLNAVANDAPAAPDATAAASEPATPAPSLYPEYREAWQLGIGYQYQHYNVLSQTTHDNGFYTDVTRYLSDLVGIEGTATMGFGNTTGNPSRVAKSLFFGGGPHVAAYKYTRLEPWAHLLVGLQHFRFTQTGILGSNGVLGSNNALGFMAGVGIDYKFLPHISWRFQGDYIGTMFQSAIQTNYSFGSGLIVNF